jgi:hypothetical protein
MEQIDASLARLGTDYVDLYQIHRFDPETPVEETMEALHDVVKAGKARTPTLVWPLVVDGEIYLRAANGQLSSWYSRHEPEGGADPRRRQRP